jgi:hypothetical protein
MVCDLQPYRGKKTNSSNRSEKRNGKTEVSVVMDDGGFHCKATISRGEALRMVGVWLIDLWTPN